MYVLFFEKTKFGVNHNDTEKTLWFKFITGQYSAWKCVVYDSMTMIRWQIQYQEKN